MDLYQAIRERRSIRKYKPEPVPKDVILKVLEAANWAPSGMNLQQWKFYVLSGGKRDPITQLGRLTEKNYPPAASARTTGSVLRMGETYGGAPHIIVATMPRDENLAAARCI